MRALVLAGTTICAAAMACCIPVSRDSCIYHGFGQAADRCVSADEEVCWDGTVYPDEYMEESDLSGCPGGGDWSDEPCRDRGFPAECQDGTFAPAGTWC